MIELRWKLQSADSMQKMSADDHLAIFNCMTLQYRQMENVLEQGLQKPIWSAWKNVPVDIEEQN